MTKLPQALGSNSLSISLALFLPAICFSWQSTNTSAIWRLRLFAPPLQIPSSRNLTTFYSRMVFLQKSSLTTDLHFEVDRPSQYIESTAPEVA
jgi:hypothetical protein